MQKNYAELINSKIQALEYFSQRNVVINDYIEKELEYRKLIIKNYIVFYKINEREKIVEVHRILYGASDWLYEL